MILILFNFILENEWNDLMSKNAYETNLELTEKFRYAHLTSKPTHELNRSEKALEILKCKYNILYYLENYCKIPLPGGGSTELQINDKLRTVALLYQASVPHIFQTSRQSSKTTIEICCGAWYVNFWQNVKIMFFNTKIPENKKNLAEIKKMLLLLPNWMCSFDPKRDPNNVEKFRNGIESEINLMSIDRQDPDATARGNTGALYLDEFGFLKNIHTAYTPLSFIYTNYSRIARKNYVPAPFSITSTPADPLSPEGELFQDLWEKVPEVTYEEIKDLLPHEIFNYVDKLSDFRMAKVYQYWYEYPDRCEKTLYDPENPHNILDLLQDPFVDIKELEKHSASAAEYIKEVRSKCKTKTQLRREVNNMLPIERKLYLVTR